MTDKFTCEECGNGSDKIEITGYSNFVPYICDNCGAVYMIIMSLEGESEYHRMDYDDLLEFFDNFDYSLCISVTPEKVREYYMTGINQALRKHKITKLKNRFA
jgi:hypothetical protein